MFQIKPPWAGGGGGVYFLRTQEKEKADFHSNNFARNKNVVELNFNLRMGDVIDFFEFRSNLEFRRKGLYIHTFFWFMYILITNKIL